MNKFASCLNSQYKKQKIAQGNTDSKQLYQPEQNRKDGLDIAVTSKHSTTDRKKNSKEQTQRVSISRSAPPNFLTKIPKAPHPTSLLQKQLACCSKRCEPPFDIWELAYSVHTSHQVRPRSTVFEGQYQYSWPSRPSRNASDIHPWA